MRYSKQRELVMQTVQALCDHPTAEEIYDAAVKECPGLRLGTCILYTSTSPRDGLRARMQSSD